MSWEYKDLIDVCEINLGKTPSRSNKKLWDINKIGNNPLIYSDFALKILA